MTFISYAQNFEDVLLWRALGHVKNGFYIDVGANDPELHSVTKAFYDAGWYGINIEPLPSFHQAFLVQRPRDINLAIAAGACEDDLTLYDVPAVNGWASLDPAVADAHRAEGFEVIELTVPLRTLANVCLDHVRGEIHFLKIDVEGFEGKVLRGMDFVRWRPWVLVIEATLPNSRVTNHETWESLVTNARYHFAYFDGLNRYYVADEHKQLLDVLSTQPNVFDDFITHHLDKAWRATRNAEHKQSEAEQRTEQAERRAEQDIAASREAITLTNLALANANDTVARADQARQVSEANAHQTTLWAHDLEQRLIATHNSRSWRLTAPVRGIGRIARAVTGGNLKQRAHQQLSRALHRISANALARRLLIPLLTRFPALDAKVSRVLESIKQTAPARMLRMQVPEELRELPASARSFLADLKRLAATPTALPAASRARPRLAYISPLPPEKSGIADYSAELIPELARFYDVELVIDQANVNDPRITSVFPVRQLAWFEEHAHEYDRVLYHFGNSGVHRHMFKLIERHPGIVVLHDFFLSGVLDNLERDGYLPQAFLRALYDSHGYTGLLEHRKIGRNPSIWKYPANKAVLDRAIGVIVHSEFSKHLANDWYGPTAAAEWRTLPLLRGKAAGFDGANARAQARSRLGLKDDDFVICSFGMLGRTKLNDVLLDAFLASPLATDLHCMLVFVGENDPSIYGRDLARKITDSASASRISITGFVSADIYAAWLAAGDAMVQLRSQTRGETSAAVLDCLLYGAPTVINAHGSSAEIPDDVLLKLPDTFTQAQLSEALVTLRSEPALRARLTERSMDYMQARHAPRHVGQLYADAIEHFAHHSAYSRYRDLLLAAIAHIPTPTDSDLAEAAKAIAADQPASAPRQLFVDVSALVQSDFKTGIQRVVRSVLLAIIAAPPPGFRVEPVYSHGGNRSYQYARHFALDMVGERDLQLEDAPIDLRAGDVFLGLDLFTTGTAQNQVLLQKMSNRGLQIYFVVYDILPMLHPEMFHFDTDRHFGGFLNTIATVSDGLICISRAVADELTTWLAHNPAKRVAPLKIGYFHLGADIDASAPSFGLPPNAAIVLASLRARPSFLMVGTIEPRKGHAQAVAAFEKLWDAGIDVTLVIVGKLGWLVDGVSATLRNHQELGKRLIWLEGISDEFLEELYAVGTCLISTSMGEGFGLPLIEAAQHKLPIIARDIPVFREVAGEHAFYFSGEPPQALADAINDWLHRYQSGIHPKSDSMPWLTWEQSANQLLTLLFQQELAPDALTLQTSAYSAPPATWSVIVPAPNNLQSRQILVDVSTISRSDLHTGIERVVRAQLSELLRNPPPGFKVEPVYLSDAGGVPQYRYAQRYTSRLLSIETTVAEELPVIVNVGDVFYGADFCPGNVVSAGQAGIYADWRKSGVQISFLIHDILPVLRPEFFPDRADKLHALWLESIVDNADKLICISNSVADELERWISQRKKRVDNRFEISVLHHGADIAASFPSFGMPEDADKVLDAMLSGPSFLMVGTIEPRKGHLQTLAAFEQLWSEGSPIRLVIVGREGWTSLKRHQRRTIPQTIEKLANHPELGKRLIWLSDISDEYLQEIYAACTCLIFPSEAEGFGLPLIEAAKFNRPIIARNIPIFREVAQGNAYFFDGLTADDLTRAIRAWLILHAGGNVPSTVTMQWDTWAQNIEKLSAILTGCEGSSVRKG